jgi:hypothetical protein
VACLATPARGACRASGSHVRLELGVRRCVRRQLLGQRAGHIDKRCRLDGSGPYEVETIGCEVSTYTKTTPPTSTNKSPPKSAAPSPTAKPNPANASHPPKTSPPSSTSTPTPCSAPYGYSATKDSSNSAAAAASPSPAHPNAAPSSKSPRTRRLRPPTRLPHRRTHPDHPKHRLTKLSRPRAGVGGGGRQRAPRRACARRRAASQQVARLGEHATGLVHRPDRGTQ